MGIKHEDIKASGDTGLASEWNKNHILDGNVDYDQYSNTDFVIENRTNFPAGPVEGQIIYRTDLNLLYSFNGVTWDAHESTAGADFIHHDGTIDFSANQSLGGFQLTNVADPTLIQDAATKNYVDTIAGVGDNLGNHTATGVLDMSGFKINSLGAPAVDTDAATKKYVDDTAGGAPVTSGFGRIGAVVAANNDYTWAQVNKATSDIANITTKAHTSLTSIGTNTHAQIDTHIANVANPHAVTYTQVGAIQNANDKVYDSHINWGSGANEVDTDDVPVGATNKFLTTGVQAITGVKTFSSFPITPSANPVADYEVANKKYVDNIAGVSNVDQCSVYRSSSKLLGSNIPYAIDWDSELFDGNAMHDTITNNSRITINTSGYYLVNAQLSWDWSASTADCQMWIKKNGTTEIIKGLEMHQTTTSHNQALTKVVYLSAGDYIQCYAEHFTGANLSCVMNGVKWSWFSAVRLI